jgi:YesN/AraC family two-component response regulator
MESKVYCFMDNFNSDFLNIFKQVDAVNKLKPINCEKIIYGLINVLEQYTLSWNATKHKNIIISEFINKLIESISLKDVQINELIKNIPVSNSYFRKLFKAETGKSLIGYLMDLRIESAKELMVNTTLTIKAVASLVGFSDPHYFSRFFKKQTGKYPSQWREDRFGI